jgi:DNA-binding transcriptional regulator LsrR (DeoR family)/sugar/nucleoside kinase (ribokinase family)
MPKLWFMGEALIDFVPVPAPDGGPAFAPRCGGSPFNAAKAAAVAGAEVGFLGAISTDLFGEMLAADLARHGIDTAQAPRLSAPTTLAFVDLQEGEPRYAFFNEGTATRMIAPDAAGFAARPGDVVDFGSISLIDLPGADAIAAFAEAVAGQALVAIDPNARPGMTPDLAGLAAADRAHPRRGRHRPAERRGSGRPRPRDGAAGLRPRRRSAGARASSSSRMGPRGPRPGPLRPMSGPGTSRRGRRHGGRGRHADGHAPCPARRRGAYHRGALRRLTPADARGALRHAVAAAALNCTASGCAPPTPEPSRRSSARGRGALKETHRWPAPHIQTLSEDRALRLRAAWLYYNRGLTQKDIADRLGISRSSVIRLLDEARRRAEVQIWIDMPPGDLSDLAAALEERFGLDRAIVVPGEGTPEETARDVGAALGRFLSDGSARHDRGRGLGPDARCLAHGLRPPRLDGVRVVSLLGGVVETTGLNPIDFAWRLASAVGAECLLFPAPLIVDSAETKRRLIEDCGLSRIADVARGMDMAVVSCGDIGASGTSLSQGFLSAEDHRGLVAAGAVCDTMCHFLDAEGAASPSGAGPGDVGGARRRSRRRGMWCSPRAGGGERRRSGRPSRASAATRSSPTRRRHGRFWRGLALPGKAAVHGARLLDMGQVPGTGDHLGATPSTVAFRQGRTRSSAPQITARAHGFAGGAGGGPRSARGRRGKRRAAVGIRKRGQHMRRHRRNQGGTHDEPRKHLGVLRRRQMVGKAVEEVVSIPAPDRAGAISTIRSKAARA